MLSYSLDMAGVQVGLSFGFFGPKLDWTREQWVSIAISGPYGFGLGPVKQSEPNFLLFLALYSLGRVLFLFLLFFPGPFLFFLLAQSFLNCFFSGLIRLWTPRVLSLSSSLLFLEEDDARRCGSELER